MKKHEGLPRLARYFLAPVQPHLFQNCGSSMMPGIITKAGNVTRLKVPKTSKKAKTKLEESEAFCDRERESGVFLIGQTSSLAMRSIKTRLQSTISVSTEFENVCVWYVQVT